jgi:20S proteasome alpha/beta subunit
MTVAAGFVCKNGIVLCADTEITVGSGKYQQSKVVHLDHASYAVYAGDVPFVAEIAPRLREKIKATKATPNIGPEIGAEWKRCFSEYYTQLPDSEKTFAYLLLTLWHPQRIKLFSALGRTFYEVETFEIFGTGADVMRAAITPHYDPNIEIDEAAILGIYGILRAKQYAQACGGETEVVRCKQITETKAAIGKVEASRVKEIEANVEFFMRAAGPAMLSFANTTNNEKVVKSSLQGFTYSLVHYRKEQRRTKEREKRTIERQQDRILRQLQQDVEGEN